MNDDELRQIFDKDKRMDGYRGWLADISQRRPDPTTRFAPPAPDPVPAEVNTVCTPIEVLRDVSCATISATMIATDVVWTATATLNQCDFFQPLAVRNLVTDSRDPDKLRRLMLQCVDISQCYQEEWCGRGPQHRGVWTDSYLAPAGYAIPVNWACFSSQMLVQHLTLQGWSTYGSGGPTVDFDMSIFGNPMQAWPPGGGR